MIGVFVLKRSINFPISKISEGKMIDKSRGYLSRATYRIIQLILYLCVMCCAFLESINTCPQVIRLYFKIFRVQANTFFPLLFPVVKSGHALKNRTVRGGRCLDFLHQLAQK